MSEYKYWAWWNALTEEEQEAILKNVYIQQEQGLWVDLNKEKET